MKGSKTKLLSYVSEATVAMKIIGRERDISKQHEKVVFDNLLSHHGDAWRLK